MNSLMICTTVVFHCTWSKNHRSNELTLKLCISENCASKNDKDMARYK